MDALGIQGRIWRGMGVAARYLGAAFDHHRPLDPLAPINALSYRGTLTAKFDADPAFRHIRPADHGKPLYYLLADATEVRPGDYLIADQGAWFIAGIEPNVPPLAVRCNAVVSVARPMNGLAPGLNPYGGRTDATDAPMMAGWPASVLQGAGQVAGRADLPGDARQSGREILLPAWPGVVLEAGDLVRDDLGRRYVLAGAEHSALGWRCTASLEAT